MSADSVDLAGLGLHRKTIELAEQHRRSDEPVLAALKSDAKQVMLVMADRLMIVKVGFMAGTAGGGRVSEFPYQDIVSLEVSTGLMSGAIEVLTAAYTEKNFWSGNKNRDPWKASNCLPIPSKRQLRAWAPHLESIRRFISEAKAPPSPQVAPSTDGSERVEDALERVVALHRAGALSDDEFARAKAKILDTR